MDNKDRVDGGTAFPAMGTQTDGMSLRDYFAIRMAAALASNSQFEGATMADELAAHAYKVADAMLAERRKA